MGVASKVPPKAWVVTFAGTAINLCLAGGCVLAGLLRSYAGLVLGFGVLGGIGMGLGYAAATPAAVRWFGPHRRGLVVGLVVGLAGLALFIGGMCVRFEWI